MRTIGMATVWLLLAGQPFPQDAFQDCAVKALRGDYGPLQDWQREAYSKGLKQGVTVKGLAFVTWYGPQEGRQGQVDRYGNRCTLRTAASNTLPRKSYVWISSPCQMRQVLDCGARYNTQDAYRRGCDYWIDVWHPKPFGTRNAKYAVIRSG